jgi:hypothetical protein
MKKYLLFISIFIFCSLAAKAVDCPADFVPGEWKPETFYIQLESMKDNPIAGWVDYYWRYSGSGIEVVVDWSTLYNPNIVLSNESMMDLIYCCLAKYITNYNSKEGETFEISFIFQTECKVYTDCYVRFKNNAVDNCCDDPTISPEYYSYGGWRYGLIPRNKVCGTKCCELVYTMYNGGELKDINVLSIVTQDYPGSSCPESEYYKCYPGGGWLIPCQGHCER